MLTEILIVIAIILVVCFIVLIAVAVSLSKKEFCCKKCGNSFKASWKKLIFVTHYNNEYSVKCPNCDNKRCETK